MLFSSIGISQDHSLNGHWEFIPEKSTHIDLFGKMDVEIDINDDEIRIVRIWGKGSNIHRDTFLLEDSYKLLGSLPGNCHSVGGTEVHKPK